MRWDALSLDGQEPGLFGPPVTVDTPEFRGITFHEIHAKSIINKVPAVSRVPFTWTINPYRGCSHACAYCLHGDTPILMADGRTKPIRDLRVGDAVYGTQVRGACRRYVVTEVLAHWRTVKPAHRIRLADGTELIASGDHRFLTDRGWKYVTGSGQGTGGRPHLMRHTTLMGTGGFADHTIEKPDGRPLSVVRLRGGLTRTRDIEGVALKSSPGLGVASVEAIGMDVPMYDITTGTGDFIANGVVSHNCFARNTHTYLGFDAGHDFDSQIVVKVNAPDLVRRELAAPRWAGEHIAMGTNVDCYQRAEGRYRLMPGIIEALRDAANPFSILTKGSLILRDLPLLEEAAERTEVGAAVSVGFVDKELWRLIEPGTPSPRTRLEVCATLNSRGIGCGVLMGPVVPYLTDSPRQLAAAVRDIAAAGATSVSAIVLHLRPGAREWFMRWLRETRPELVAPYERLYGRGAYAPKDYQRRIAAKVAELAAEHGIGGRPNPRRVPARPAATPTGSAAGPVVEQLRLL